MSDTTSDAEQLREALLEVSILRAREAANLRETRALLDALEAVTTTSDPATALEGLLNSVRANFGAESALIASEEGGKLQILHATDPKLVGHALPDRLAAKGSARCIVDLSAVDWWEPPAALAASAALLSAAIDLPGRPSAVLVATSPQPGAFKPTDRALFTRLCALASQALSVLALAERNALLAAVIDGASASVTIADARKQDAPLIYVNPAFEQMSGYGQAEVLGANCRLLSAEDPDAPERARLRRAVAERGSGTFDLLNRRKSGEMFWNRLSLYPVEDTTGEAAYLVATQVDITAERAAEDARDRARWQLIGALSATSEGFLLLDAAGEIVFANARFRDFFETEGAIFDDGKPFVDSWAARLVALGTPPGSAKRLARARRDALFAGGADREEVLPDGRILLVNDRPTRDGGAVSIATDVTALKATERLLRQRAIAIDAAQDGIAITDPDGRLLYTNPAYLALFGYARPGEILGRPWLSLYDTESRRIVEEVAMPTLTAQGTWRGEATGRARDGTTVEQEVSLTLVRGQGIVCVTRDIAARKQMARERERLQTALGEAERQEILGQMAAGIAHDFNNLLSAIRGSTDLLRDAVATGGLTDTHIDRIEAASARGAALIARLAKLGRRTPEAAPLDLLGPFDEAVELLRAGLPARITLDVARPAGSIRAVADGTAFLQVVLNLAINARDAIRPAAGRISMSLDVASELEGRRTAIGRISPEGRYALLTVADTGPGIEANRIDEIFAPYVTTKGTAGTGLGLAVVSSIVSAAGGAVEVDSNPGAGACFRVYWPLDAAPAALPVPQPEVARAEVDLSGRLILLCEDDAALAEILAEALGARGAEVAVCVDPRDALEAVREAPEDWDLLVTDFDLPEMSGAELARAVRDAAPTLPIVLCTALVERPETKELFDATLAKPVSTAHLIETAAAAIRAGKE